jgi:Tfp pilus assembly protein PilN
MSSNKNNRVTIVIGITIGVLCLLMLLVYGLVQRTSAIAQQKISLQLSLEKAKLVEQIKQVTEMAAEQQRMAQAQSAMAEYALLLCEKQKTVRK